MTRLSLTAFSLLVLAGPALAATGSGMAAAQNGDAARVTKALNVLEAKGYGSFTNFRADGTKYAATVTQNGQPLTVVINPDNGQVTQQS
jgi:hypothetical protein